jgi:hypothetical protein
MMEFAEIELFMRDIETYCLGDSALLANDLT